MTIQLCRKKIHLNCNGEFKIDDIGIRSMQMIDLKSAEWKKNTLTLTENSHPNVNINGGSVIVSGNANIVGNITNISTINGKSTNISIINRGSTVKVNGVEYNQSYESEGREKKEFEMRWIDTEYQKPALKSLEISGSTTAELNIKLHDKCKMSASGSSLINVWGDHINTILKLSVSGASKVTGNGKLKGLHTKTHGCSTISGFHVMNKIKINSSGCCNVNIKCSTKCKISKSVTGILNEKIYRE